MTKEQFKIINEKYEDGERLTDLELAALMEVARDAFERGNFDDSWGKEMSDMMDEMTQMTDEEFEASISWMKERIKK
jgi:hypothetical protein